MKYLHWHSRLTVWLGLISLVWICATPIQLAQSASSKTTECLWTGRWVSDRGLMNFNQSGTAITATFTGGSLYPESPAPGTLQGTVSGMFLTGTWSDTAGNAGNVELSGDGCAHFTGSWDLGDPNVWESSWEGHRVVADVFSPLVWKK